MRVSRLRHTPITNVEQAHCNTLSINLRDVPAAFVAKAHRQLRQIELLFRWLKHGPRIQTFGWATVVFDGLGRRNIAADP